MKEQLIPRGVIPRGENSNNNSVPIHKMPDFQAALKDYRRVLEENNVPLPDIERVTKQIQSNPTRRSGNHFINLVNGITREKNPKAL